MNTDVDLEVNFYHLGFFTKKLSVHKKVSKQTLALEGRRAQKVDNWT